MVRIYVEWDAWHHLSALERSELIMDAFELVCGQDKAGKVLVVMGL